jgi:chromosome segregation ATPase
VVSESDFKDGLQMLLEVNDVESDIADLTTRLDDLTDNYEELDLDFDDTKGRVSYIRQLTAEFLEYLKTLNNELETQVDIPNSTEIMNKMLSRTERKRYYMSKFRL